MLHYGLMEKLYVDGFPQFTGVLDISISAFVFVATNAWLVVSVPPLPILYLEHNVDQNYGGCASFLTSLLSA